MRKPMVIYEQFEVVIVPFPFTDNHKTKKRPALVISDRQGFSIDKSVLAIITTTNHSPWSLDPKISNISPTGLKAPSIEWI